MEVAMKMKIDFVARLYPRPSTSGRSAFKTENWAERGFPRNNDSAFADSLQSLGKADRGDGFSFTRNGRCRRGHQDQLASPPVSGISQQFKPDLGAESAYRLKVSFVDVEFARDRS